MVNALFLEIVKLILSVTLVAIVIIIMINFVKHD